MASCAEWLDTLSQGAPSVCWAQKRHLKAARRPAPSAAPAAAREVTASLPTQPAPRPRSGQPVRTAGVKAPVAQGARAGQPFSRSQSRNSLLKGKQRGGLAGDSWLVVPGSHLWGAPSSSSSCCWWICLVWGPVQLPSPPWCCGGGSPNGLSSGAPCAPSP